MAHVLSDFRQVTMPSPTFGRYVPYFLDRVGQPDANGCLPWLGSVSQKGYGVLAIGPAGYSKMAHRFAYEYWVEPIETGLTIDHRCYNRLCVCPGHLEAVTQAVNASRRRLSTHCTKGHELTEDNIYYSTANDNRIRKRRQCKICTNQRQRGAYARRKAKREAANENT